MRLGNALAKEAKKSKEAKKRQGGSKEAKEAKGANEDHSLKGTSRGDPIKMLMKLEGLRGSFLCFLKALGGAP